MDLIRQPPPFIIFRTGFPCASSTRKAVLSFVSLGNTESVYCLQLQGPCTGIIRFMLQAVLNQNRCIFEFHSITKAIGQLQA